MRKLVFAGIVVALAGVVGFGLMSGTSDAQSVVVFKTPTCGCCGSWVDHLRDSGFEVDVRDLDNLSAIKAQYGVPQAMRTCHTALVDGYVVEGHVPARFVTKLLDERPDIAGIAVPGMPIGSPGMEVPGTPNAAYDVLAFNTSGKTAVFGHVEGD
jgi:hypothetical protein